MGDDAASELLSATQQNSESEGSAESTLSTTNIDGAGAGADPQQTRPSKRRKAGNPRIRVTRACDRCKTRKTRCSGKCPCTLCSQWGLDCQFTAAYRRGRLPSIETETDDRVLQMARTAAPTQPNPALITHVAPSAEAVGSLPIPSPISIDQHHLAEPQGALPAAAGLRPPETSSAAHSSRSSPEPLQSDQQGHYVGPASGASFLLRIQRKLVRQKTSLSSESSIFTFGDLPLPEFDPSFFILPPKNEAQALLARYFEFASATHRFLHRPTVEAWLSELYETNGSMKQKATSRSRTALLFIVFALAKSYSKPRLSSDEDDSGARFFSAAEHQLAAEKGEIRLTSVQARLAQCFYLLAHSRINHCWSLFGTTAHLMLALGIHRKKRVDPSQGVDYVDLECRKRTFWCAYNLDTYLSAALGRPRTFHDEDIDQEMPSLVNDADLHHHQMHPAPPSAQSIMTGPVAHLKLSRVIARILRDLYGLKPPSTDERLRIAAKYDAELNDWRNGLAYFLNTDGVDPALFLPLFFRQRNVLNLAFWHAQILVHRPFLLSNFADLTNYSTNRSRLPSNPDLTVHVQKCLNAAMSITKLVDNLISTGMLYGSFWFTHYFAFCAVVILYIYTIQQRNSPPEKYLQEFHAAAKCQSHLSSIAAKGSLADRYGMVLQELRSELLRHNSYLALQYQSGSSVHFATESDEGQEEAQSQGQHEQHGQHAQQLLGVSNGTPGLQGGLPGGFSEGDFGMQDAAFTGSSPSSSIAQMTGWGQFDSLATGGVGGIESLLTDDMGTWDLDILPGNMRGLT